MKQKFHVLVLPTKQKRTTRDRIAEELGFKILRFHDEEVVQRSILIEIKTREDEINLF